MAVFVVAHYDFVVLQPGLHCAIASTRDTYSTLPTPLLIFCSLAQHLLMQSSSYFLGLASSATAGAGRSPMADVHAPSTALRRPTLTFSPVAGHANRQQRSTIDRPNIIILIVATQKENPRCICHLVESRSSSPKRVYRRERGIVRQLKLDSLGGTPKSWLLECYRFRGWGSGGECGRECQNAKSQGRRGWSRSAKPPGWQKLPARRTLVDAILAAAAAAILFASFTTAVGPAQSGVSRSSAATSKCSASPSRLPWR